MPRLSLRGLSWSFAALAILGVSTGFVISNTRALRSRLEETLAKSGIALAGGLSAAPGPDLQKQVNDLASQPGVLYAAVFDSKLHAWVRSENAPANLTSDEAGQGDESSYLKFSRSTIQSRGEETPVLDVLVPNKANLASCHLGLALGDVDLQLATAKASSIRLAAILVGISLLLLWILLTLAFAPLRRIAEEAARVTGALGAPEGLGEAHQLRDSLERLIAKVKHAPGSLSPITQQLNESIRQIMAATRKHEELLDRQSAALQEAQVTAQEIRQVSLAAATSAGDVISAAEQAEQLGTVGEKALEVSVDELTAIRAQVDAISKQIAALGEQTTQIGAVTATVKGLADQSSMLALNAAIEAVRAGKHGQGFSTVAHEIRSLADQSIEATQRVRDLLEDIDRATREAVRFTEQGAERIDAGLKEVRTTGDMLRRLSTLVRENAIAVRQIADSVSQQNAGISQLFDAINDLGRMMETGINGLEDSHLAATEIERVAGELNKAVQGLR